MKIHLSTATVRAYENTKKSMNLHFNPIIIFEDSWPFPIDHLKNVRWEILAEPIGAHTFDVVISVYSPFEVENEKNFVEFHLSKTNIPFQYDDYHCHIIFRATLDSPHTSPYDIKQNFWGVVKTIWSKGLESV